VAGSNAAARGRPRVANDQGQLQLAFRRDPRGRSVLRSRRQRFPLRMTAPLYLDPAAPDMAFVYVQNPTGGVFAGDSLLIEVTADAGTRVHLTTQSATKLYRMDRAEARQELRFRIAERAYVEHIPDALIPQAGARYRQVACVELGDGAALVTAEMVAPGRRAHGERFAFERLELAVDVHRGGAELCADRLVLEPARARPDRAGVLGDCDYLVSLLVLAPESDAGALAASIDAVLAGHGGAAGELPNRAGAIARALCPTASDAEHALRGAWGAAREVLTGLPAPQRRK
jgi:urease accessory protein